MKHPFQRPSNDKDTVKTPFQLALVGFIEGYSKGGDRMTGRRLSRLLGRSANHISQMMNDGFVPSGPAILEMAQVLDLDREATDRLIRAAMETKAAQRSRDSFWIQETTRMLADRDKERAYLFDFLKKEGLLDGWKEYLQDRKRRARKQEQQQKRRKRPGS